MARLFERQGYAGRSPSKQHKPTKELNLTIVGILIVIILVLLAIYLFRRVF